MPRKKQTEDWYHLYLFDRWQRLQRHPDYRLFCRKYKNCFNWTKETDDGKKSGIGHIGERFEEIDKNDALESIKKRFGLSIIYHYKSNITASDLLAIPQIFKDNTIVSPRINTKELKDEEIEGKENKYRTISEFSIIRDEHYIDCRINIHPTIILDEIMEEVKSWVKQARSEFSAKYKRAQFESNQEAYKIYDLRSKRLSFKKISHELGINDQTAKAKFTRAWELIHGEKYEPKNFTALIEQGCAERGEWDKMPKLPTLTEKLSCEFIKDGDRCPTDVIEGHSEDKGKLSGDDTAAREAHLRLALPRLKEYCHTCTNDAGCSAEMITAFDFWITSGVSSDFSKASPCPSLKEEIIDLLRP